MTDLPKPIVNGLQKAATDYANSPHTTNAGLVLRFFAKVIPVSVVIKLFAHALSKK